MKVTIGVPYYLSITAEMTASLIHGVMRLPYELHFAFIGGGHIDQNREVILDMALAEKSDRLLFIDSDIMFQPDAILRLLAHAQPIIGAAYNYKTTPTQSVVLYDVPPLPGTHSPVRCSRLPTGFLSLHLPTLAKVLPRPWFWYEWDPKAKMGGVIGEDVHFNRIAKDAGFELWVDPTIKLQHMGTYPY